MHCIYCTTDGSGATMQRNPRSLPCRSEPRRPVAQIGFGHTMTHMSHSYTRRVWLKHALLAAIGSCARAPALQSAGIDDQPSGKASPVPAPETDDKLKQETRDFIVRCQR